MDRDVRTTRMHRILAETGNNFTGSARMYRERFPEDGQPPSRQSFRRLAATEQEHGVLKRAREQRIKPVRDGPVRAAVEHAVQENGRRSLRRLARTLQVPRESVRKIARELNRPFKYQPVQKLCPGDAERRLTYCRWGLERLQEDPDFFRNVCFTDEALFTNLELVNKQNCRWWAPENPHWIVEQDNQHRWKLHVWAGVLQDRILGPIFLDGNLTSAKYRTVLTEELPRLMDGNPIRMDQVWWQQDGAPAHNSNANKAILDAMFPERWIGTRGPVRWPARSPDLTVCDFWFWSRIKEIVYERAPTTKHDMRHRIAEACAAIPVREMQRVRGSIRKRLALTVQQNGGHIEHLLKQRNQE